jgi:phospholipase/lecithinase/hemolysin
MRKQARAVALAALFGVAFGVGPAASAGVFMPSQFVVFGDSFVDAGSVNRFTGGALAPASDGFWQGRWSDGPNWVDYLGYANFGTTTKAFNAGVGPGMLPPPFQLGATNFAVGGARASGDDVQPGGTIPGLNSQLLLYSAYNFQFSLGVDPNALYIINFGNNDVNFIQSLADPVQQAAVATAYVTNLTNAALGLAQLGANHILIAGVPNPLEIEGQLLQAALNASLAAQAPIFGVLGADVQQFDYFAFFTALSADPTVFGLPAGLNFTTPCLTAETPSPDIDCRNYLRFDEIHVTTGVQRAISIQVANQLGISAIPEPASWAMMILGFGLVGGMARRRRTAQAA